MNAMRHYNRYPAEFEPQRYVQIIFPHKKSDWVAYLPEAEATFSAIIKAIARFETCVIICADVLHVMSFFDDHTNLVFIPYETDDTWARDCSSISVTQEGETRLLDFTFTGWGGKFDATRDNAMSQSISSCKSVDFILEGGAIESNGKGALLTTSACLLNPNRNATMNKAQIEHFLKQTLHVNDIYWLNHGYLAGDDTDSHIDTLARFVDEETLMYVQCDDPNDEHYNALKAMETELLQMPFKLIALPMCDALYFDNERLPATYANFLFVNGAVLLPVYGVRQDHDAIAIFKATFPDREIVPIDCSVLVRQHGSLHCVTMHYPLGAPLPAITN